MIVLFIILIFCFDINQDLTNTTFEDKSKSFAQTLDKGFNEKYESDEKKKKGQEGQLSESSTTTKGEGEKEIRTENSRKERRISVNDAQIDKVNSKVKEKAKDKVKVKAVESDRPKYNFKPSGIGDSWLIGTDNTNSANAFPNGVSGCPYNLIIPSTLTDDDGQTKKVEIIGQFAFFACADKDYNGQTRKLTLTRQVKVIKYCGLGYMDNLEEFTLEGGSVLETIESRGLEYIGLVPGYTESNRVTLILPSTLSSVFEDGIRYCNLFNVIIYCGSNPLSNSSKLDDISNTVVKVSSEYPSGENIFGRSPDRNSQKEVEASCSKMDGRPILKPTPPSYSSSFTPLKKTTLCLAAFFFAPLSLTLLSSPFSQPRLNTFTFLLIPSPSPSPSPLPLFL